MKAIPTRYKGYHFRSRLEARWAVFFDTAGITWTYEPEGFLGEDGTPYLPDFLLSLPDEEAFIEIKPTMKLSAEDQRKLFQFQLALDNMPREEDHPQFYVLAGEPYFEMPLLSKYGVPAI